MSELDSFDDMISAAIRARPEHEPRMDVAAVAIARVRAQEERVARLARISWWTRVSGVAAGLLIALTAGVGYWLWPASTSSTTDTVDAASTLTTTSSIDMTTVGVAAFVVTLIAIVLLTVMTPERQTLRLTPA